MMRASATPLLWRADQGHPLLFLQEGGRRRPPEVTASHRMVCEVSPDCFLQQEADILQISGVGPGAAGGSPVGQFVRGGSAQPRLRSREPTQPDPTLISEAPAPRARAGDIGAGVDIVVSQGLSSRPVQGGHHPVTRRSLSELIPFDAGGVNPDSDGFGQEEAVAGEGTALAPDLVRVDRSCYDSPTWAPDRRWNRHR